MTESRPSDNEPGELATAVVSRRRGFSIVWLVPVVAALVAAWLAYVAVTEKGPRITVSFQTAAGIEAGKTRVKFRDVNIGLVEAVEIGSDQRSVLVTIDFDKSASKHLTDATTFWVVTARLDASGVSGLGTVVSGAYIEIEPGSGGPALDHYVGLETPPVVRIDEPGRRYMLKSQSASSLGPHTPIYFRGIRVGEVLGYELAGDSRTIQSFIFVKAPYDQYVRENTHFWNVGGIEVTAGSEGFKLKVESVQALITGGIEFDSPTDQAAAEQAADGTVFPLYGSREAVGEAEITERIPYLLYFEGSVRGLNVGAPVEFRGVRIGTVSDIRPHFDMPTNTIRIAVIINIEPQRLEEESTPATADRQQQRYLLMERLVENGLRAQMQNSSLITGQQLVSLDFHPELPKKSLDRSGEVPEIPTIPSTISGITAAAGRVLEKIEKMPLDQLVAEIQQTVGTLDATLNEARSVIAATGGSLTPMMAELQKTATTANATLRQAESTIASIDRSVGDSSEVRQSLTAALRELADAARSIRQLAEYLERNPDALIKGKTGP